MVRIAIPHEFDFGGVYLSPLLVAAVLGVTAAWATARLLNRLRFSRHLYSPPLMFIAMAVIYTSLIGIFLIPV